MKIVFLGAGGQLAHDLRSSLSDHQLLPWTRAELDVTDADRVAAQLRQAQPDVVINTAAYNLVDQAEEDVAAAFTVNHQGPLNLARACAELDVVLAHFSTDYVFGLVDSDRPWRESDAPGPVSVYGTSKLAGEYAVRSVCPKHYVIRTCGLYGVKGSRGKGGNFVETMIRLGKTKDVVRVVNDQRCTPSCTADIASATAQLITTNQYGLYHMTNAGQSSWFELASEVFARMKLGVRCEPITSEEFAAPAARPAYSMLDCGKLVSAGVDPLPDWRDALARYLVARKTD